MRSHKKTSVRRAALALALSAPLLAAAPPAWAGFGLVVTATGVIASGTDGDGLFGAPGASLAGDAYTLAVTASNLGSNRVLTPNDDSVTGLIPGSVTASVNGRSVTVAILVPAGADFYEDFGTGDLSGSNAGGDGARYVSASVLLTTFIPLADLTQPYSYAAQPGDFGSAYYCEDAIGGNCANKGTTFTAGTPASIAIATVPEPAPVLMMGAGLAALGLAAAPRRRRR